MQVLLIIRYVHDDSAGHDVEGDNDETTNVLGVTTVEVRCVDVSWGQKKKTGMIDIGLKVEQGEGLVDGLMAMMMYIHTYRQAVWFGGVDLPT